MTDYTELQKAAAYSAQDTIKFADEDEEMRALQKFHEEVDPETILALIAENERLNTECKQLILLECHGGTAQAAVNLLTERDQLKAELEKAQLIGRLAYNFDGYKAVLDERDQLRAEVAGLKTGYEAYERVNAELKAENEALRKDAERYRWLRQDDVEQCRISRTWSEEQMDAAIDAALGKGEQS